MLLFPVLIMLLVATEDKKKNKLICKDKWQKAAARYGQKQSTQETAHGGKCKC